MHQNTHFEWALPFLCSSDPPHWGPPPNTPSPIRRACGASIRAPLALYLPPPPNRNPGSASVHECLWCWRWANEFVNGHSLRPELSYSISLAITVQVCLGQVRYIQLALNGFLVSGHCSSRCCLQLVCQETEFLCKSRLAFAVSRRCCCYSSRCHRIVTHTVA